MCQLKEGQDLELPMISKMDLELAPGNNIELISMLMLSKYLTLSLLSLFPIGKDSVI